MNFYLGYGDLGHFDIVSNIFNNIKDNKNKINKVKNSKSFNNNKVNRLEDN